MYKKKKVLVFIKNVFSETGGGQTYYQKLFKILKHIDFYYFYDNNIESKLATLKNINLIALKNKVNIKTDKPLLSSEKNLLIEANQFARSTTNSSFDFIEFPDFCLYGLYIKEVCAMHNIFYVNLIISLHGNLSDSIRLNWDESSIHLIKNFENRMYEKSDIVHGISSRYIKEKKYLPKKKTFFIDPIHFVDFITPKKTSPSIKSKVNILCVGRLERRKGNDIFVDFINHLDKKNIKSFIHIGEDVKTGSGFNASDLLSNMSKNRSTKFTYQKKLSRKDLLEYYKKNTLLIVPTRYDTLNLVVLEALFSGCPVVVSNKAGVIDYIKSHHPQLPYVDLNLENIYESTTEINKIVNNYSDYKNNLVNLLKKYKPNNTEINYLYSYKEKNENINDLFKYKEIADLKRLIKSQIKVIFKYTKVIKYLLKKILINRYTYRLIGLFRLTFKIIRSYFYRDKLNRIYLNFNNPEYIHNGIKNYFFFLFGFKNQIYQMLSFAADVEENSSISLIYKLRSLRLAPVKDSFSLKKISLTANSLGFSEASKVVELFYPNDFDNKKCLNYFQDRFNLLRKIEIPDSYKLINDKRSKKKVKISVITTIYNANPKLKRFLSHLVSQSAFLSGDAELIIIDSNSGDSSYKTFNDYQNLINAVYFKTMKRETIQYAWNRGISHARGEYLVFLGVDEMLYHDSLMKLSNFLDKNQNIDWVMGNSIVTEVDENGVFVKDLMFYDRSKSDIFDAFFETCHVSWVGGMYRKNIHDKYGFYDPSFSAAGDTEFKSRILKYISVGFIDETLGKFLNYPDGQITASTKAEIEDLRAWYIFKTYPGVEYSFKDLSKEQLVKIFIRSFGFRRSFSNRKIKSTYIHFSQNIFKFIKNNYSELFADHSKLFESIYDNYDIFYRSSSAIKVLVSFLKLKFYQSKINKLKGFEDVKLNPFYDNVYEQHNWVW